MKASTESILYHMGCSTICQTFHITVKLNPLTSYTKEITICLAFLVTL